MSSPRDAVAPSWYPDPQRDGMLRWWDGTRWTEHVQPAPDGRQTGRRAGGHRRDRPVTCYGPNEPVTHAFPPITDERYAGSPLAEAIAEHVRGDRSGGDVQIPIEHQAAVEAAYQLRKRGGVRRRDRGRRRAAVRGDDGGEARRPTSPLPGWMVGPGNRDRPRRACRARPVGQATGRRPDGPRGGRRADPCCGSSSWRRRVGTVGLFGIGLSSSLAVPRRACRSGCCSCWPVPLAPALHLVVDVRADSRDGARGEGSLT